MTDRDCPFTILADEPADLAHHHGALPPAVGIHSYQVLRANRDHPEQAEGTGWTYNHAPMLCWWRGRFYLLYLSNPVHEHVPPGQTLLATSEDGREWSRPQVVFPPYEVPGGVYRGEDWERVEDGVQAVMHQRMGFYVAPDGRLLTLGFYGISPRADLAPFDSRGIGRVVREVYGDGRLGPIYFIRTNTHAGWGPENTAYPAYTEAEDEGFRAACDALLADSLAVQQWHDEHGDADPLIPLKGSYKALSAYTLPDGRHAAFWKWSKAGVTPDKGLSWDWLGEVPTLETAAGKVWGQRTSDGRYALCYNPSTNNWHRWPLAVTTGDDGLTFGGLLCLSGHVPPCRYRGGHKDFGLNYVRGIWEGNGAPPDGNLWITYSVNKEDIWVSRVRVPVASQVDEPVDDAFALETAGEAPPLWNIYSPLWAPVRTSHAPGPDGKPVGTLRLEDADPYDYAWAERVFPESVSVRVRAVLRPEQNGHGQLFVELWDPRGAVPVRIVWDHDGWIKVMHGRGIARVRPYEPSQWYTLELMADAARRRVHVSLDGELTGSGQVYHGQTWSESSWYFLAPARCFSRVVFRTKPLRRSPTVDTALGEVHDLPGAGEPISRAVYHIARLRTADHVLR